MFTNRVFIFTAPLPAPRMEINHEIISLNETTIGPYTEREMLNASCSLSHSCKCFSSQIGDSYLKQLGHCFFI